MSMQLYGSTDNRIGDARWTLPTCTRCCATYGEMMPLCAHMTGIARHRRPRHSSIRLRIWSSLARAEPIDIFPLHRPFVLGFCIMFFRRSSQVPSAPYSARRTGTEKLVHVQQNDLNHSATSATNSKGKRPYRRDKSPSCLIDDAAWDEKVREMGFIGPEDAITLAGMYAERTAFNTKRWFVKKICQASNSFYNAASLVIDTPPPHVHSHRPLHPRADRLRHRRGDGLGGSLSAWFARYISVYLWLPVSSILTALLTKNTGADDQQGHRRTTESGYVPDSGDWYYIVFFIVWHRGASSACRRSRGWIIEAGGGIGHGHNVNQTAQRGVQGAHRRQGDDGRNGCHTRQCRRTDQGFYSLNNESIDGIQITHQHRDLVQQIRLSPPLSLCWQVITGIVVYSSYAFATVNGKIYVLDNGKSLILALSQDAAAEPSVEAREHVRRFHELFFTVAPDKDAIEKNMGAPSSCATKRHFDYYRDLAGGLLQPHHLGQHQPARGGGLDPLRLRSLPVWGDDLRPPVHRPSEQRDGRNLIPTCTLQNAVPPRQQPAGLPHGALPRKGE